MMSLGLSTRGPKSVPERRQPLLTLPWRGEAEAKKKSHRIVGKVGQKSEPVTLGSFSLKQTLRYFFLPCLIR